MSNTPVALRATTGRVKRDGSAKGRRRVRRTDRAEVIRLYGSGLSSVAVAERMNLSKSGVVGIVRAEGVTIRPQGVTHASASRREDGSVSRFVQEIRQARAQGRLGERFRAADVRQACPGWADHTYGVFLPKHREGNPGGYTPYFRQNSDGSYSLLT